MRAAERIIVALDVATAGEARRLVDDLVPAGAVWFKVGLELITPGLAPEVVRYVRDRGGRVFWDGKVDDIPNTVAAAVRQAAGLGVAMLDVHASAGAAAMEAAVGARGDATVLAVTVLTSMSEAESERLFGAGTAETVRRFARMAEAAGCGGVVCSPADLAGLGEFKGLVKVTPGTRPEWAALGDQRRVMTPREAVEAGSDYLVIGRPITRPPEKLGSPAAAFMRIVEEIESGE